MKYGTSIIVLAIVNILVVFSGLPTGWKQGIVVVSALILILIGWVLCAIAKRRQMRVKAVVAEIENDSTELHQVADMIAHDVEREVETELESLSEGHLTHE